MKRRTIVAVAAFALLLGIFFATREKQVQVGVRKLELPVIDAAKVAKIDIGGQHPTTLTRDGEGWKVEDPKKPGPHPADESQVKNFLDLLGKTRFSDIVTDRPQRQAELELDEAKGTPVTLTAAGWEKPLALVFGSAAKGGSYVREQGQADVFVALGRAGTLARRAPNDWRQHRILTLQVGDIVGLDVKPASGAGYSLSRGSGDKWQLANPPAGFRLDSGAGQQLAQQISVLSTQDFVDSGETDQALGLAGPHDVVAVKLKDGKSTVLHFARPAGGQGSGASKDEVALRVEGDAQIYRVTPSFRDTIVRQLDGLRDLTLLDFDPAKVKALSLRGQKPVSLQKDGTTWKVVAPKTLPAGADFDPSQVPLQLARFKSMRAASRPEQAVPAAKAGLASTPLVELTLEDGSKQTLRFGKPVEGGAGGKRLYVQGSADKWIYEIPEADKTRFDSGLDVFKKPPPPPDVSKMQGLSSLPPEIRKQIEAQLRQRAAAPPH
jgi:hypothetical protein